MAGLKAAVYAPTWPDINGKFFPRNSTPSSGISKLFDDPIMVHFIHRNLAYLITVLIFFWFIKARRVKNNLLFMKTNWLPFVLVLLQVLLGILILLNSPNTKALLWLGVTHQFAAMVLLLSLVFEFYLLHNKKVKAG
jgi:cytochrome c oxidase assembly protein subunit 15